ncbi:MAG: PadR family transcriptional regulator [Acidobacteriota bacterium]
MPKTSQNPNSLLPMKPADLLLLAVLQDGPQHGYALSQAMARRSAERVTVRPGDLYRVLYRLSEQGLVEALEPAGPEERRKTAYALTERGRTLLIEEARRLADLSAEILSHASTGGRR